MIGDELPTKNGVYTVIFGTPTDYVTWHSFDLIDGRWWDGSEIVTAEFVAGVATSGTDFKRMKFVDD